MQFQLECPPPMEVVSVEVTESVIKLVPQTVRGQHIVRVAYATAIGNNGAKAKAVLMFNGNTGEFTVQRLDGEPAAFPFDKKPAGFKAAKPAAPETPPAPTGPVLPEVPNAATH